MLPSLVAAYSSDIPTPRNRRSPMSQGLHLARTMFTPGVLVCRVTGEVDLATAELLRREFVSAQRDEHARAIVVDLSAVTFFGSYGVEALLQAAVRSDRLMVVCSPAVKRTLTIVDVAKHLRCHDTVADAVSAAAAPLDPTKAIGDPAVPGGELASVYARYSAAVNDRSMHASSGDTPDRPAKSQPGTEHSR